MPAITDEVKRLRETLDAKVAANQAIVDEVKGTGDTDAPLKLEKGHREAFQANLGDIKQLREDIAMLTDGEDAAQFAKGLTEPARHAAAAAQAAGVGAAGAKGRDTIGAQFVQSDEFKAMRDAGLFTMGKPWEVKADLSAHAMLDRKDVFSGMPGGTDLGGFGSVERDPIVPRPQRTVRVRDLFPARPTSAAVIEYFRVTGFTNSSAPVAQRTGTEGVDAVFTAKPQSALTFEGAQAPTRTIAHWEAAHRNALSDEPQLAGIIDSELLYGLRLTEDDQILNGDGTGENLLGVLNTPGIQSYSWSTGTTGDNKADAIRRAATLALLAYYEPTGVVVHDSDWEDIELTKGSDGHYLLAVSIAMGGEPRVWRMPIVATPAIAAGTALVGAFGLGSQLYDREQSNIRVAEQHADFFVRNAVVILAEQRLALATKRPESFVEVTFDAAPA